MSAAETASCPWTPAQMTDVFGTRYYFDDVFGEEMKNDNTFGCWITNIVVA